MNVEILYGTLILAGLVCHQIEKKIKQRISFMFLSTAAPERIQWWVHLMIAIYLSTFWTIIPSIENKNVKSDMENEFLWTWEEEGHRHMKELPSSLFQFEMHPFPTPGF